MTVELDNVVPIDADTARLLARRRVHFRWFVAALATTYIAVLVPTLLFTPLPPIGPFVALALLVILAQAGAFSPDADSAGKRSLRLAALGLLNHIDGGAHAAALYASANNLTERAAALAALIAAGKGDAEVQAFYNEFKDVRLVIDMWFMLQPLNTDPAQAVAVARRLADHPDFDWKNPNRFRALIGGLSANHAAFHAADGSGYDFLADWLLNMDPLNPQIAARMSSAFDSWRKYDAARQDKARAALDRILAAPKLSKNLSEMVTRIRHAA